MHYITLLFVHRCAFTIDHAEPKSEEPTEQAQAEDLTNLVWIKSSPGAFNHVTYLLI
jgi:hypothetical protein